MGDGVTPSEGLPTHEPPTEISRFTQETREALASRFDIYELEGRTFRELQKGRGNVVISTDFWRSESGETGGDRLMNSLDAMCPKRMGCSSYSASMSSFTNSYIKIVSKNFNRE